MIIQNSNGKIQLPKEYQDKEFVLERIGEALHLLPLERDIKRLYVEVSSRCNLHCRMCMRTVREEREEGLMDEALFFQIIQEAASLPQLESIHFGGYGEPLLHPQLPLFIQQAKQKGLMTGVSSNGTLLTSPIAEELIISGLDSITISIDSMKPRLFQEIRKGGELDTIQKNLKNLKDLKKKLGVINPQVQAEIVAMKSNIQEIFSLEKKAQQLGILRFMVTNLLSHTPEMWSEVLYGEEEGRPREFFHWQIQKGASLGFHLLTLPQMAWGAERHCSFVENKALVINWTGEVSPCYPLMYSYPYYLFGRRKQVSPYRVGDVRKESLLCIWQKEEYLRFRKQVRDHRFPSCQDCPIRGNCSYALENEDCWGNSPSCADCLISQRIITCP